MLKSDYKIYAFKNSSGAYVEKNMKTQKVTIKDSDGNVISAMEFFRRFGKNPLDEIKEIITIANMEATDLDWIDKILLTIGFEMINQNLESKKLDIFSEKYPDYEISVTTMTHKLFFGYKAFMVSIYHGNQCRINL